MSGLDGDAWSTHVELMVATEQARCANCGSERIGAYCAECGQAQQDARVALGPVLKEFWDELFSLNGRLVRTLAVLLTRPGFLSREWKEGRRARYTSPLRIYLLASLVFFSVSFFLGLPIGSLSLDLGQFGTDLGNSSEALVNQLMATRMQGFLTLGAALAVPLLALWMQLQRHRSGLLYVDHLVFSVHLHSFALLVLTLAYVLLFFGTWGVVAAAALALSILGYWAASWWRSYRPDGGRLRAIRSLVISTSGWGVILLGILVGEAALFGSMLSASSDVRPLEVGTSLYNTAQRFFNEGDTLRARVLAQEALASFGPVDDDRLPEHHAFHTAEMLRFVNRSESALAAVQSLLAIDKDDALPLGLAAALAFEADDSSTARARYDRLLDRVDEGARVVGLHAATCERDVATARALLGREEVKDSPRSQAPPAPQRRP
jgi:hypothetical protein